MSLRNNLLGGGGLIGAASLTTVGTVSHFRNKQEQQEWDFLFDLSKIIFKYLSKEENKNLLSNSHKTNLEKGGVILWLKSEFSSEDSEISDEEKVENFVKLCIPRLEKETDSSNSLHVYPSSLCFLNKGKEPEDKGSLERLSLIFSNRDSGLGKKFDEFDENNQKLFEKYKEDPSSFESYLTNKLNWTSG